MAENSLIDMDQLNAGLDQFKDNYENRTSQSFDDALGSYNDTEAVDLINETIDEMINNKTVEVAIEDNEEAKNGTTGIIDSDDYDEGKLYLM